MSADLVELVQRLGHPRVLVVGDVMLDRYVWGNAERISQEAPVVLLRADRREERLIGRAQARHPQQMIRVDYENREPVGEVARRNSSAALGAKIRGADIVL